MRKAKYDRKQVICKRASCIGYSSNVAKPGYWILYYGNNGKDLRLGRVMGRIAYAERSTGSYNRCEGWLAVMTLGFAATSASVRWVNPDDVSECYERPPASLLAWITGSDWVRTTDDIARLIAMSEHGTTSEEFIASRDDAEKPYNDPARREAHCNQYIIK